MLLDIPQAQLHLLPTNSTTPFNVTSFSDAFANSTLSVSELADGDAVSFVAVGAPPGIAAGPWWNAFAFTVVESVP